MDHPYADLVKKFKSLVSEYSNNSIDVKMFGSGQLSSEDGAFKAMQIGSVDAYMVTSNNISPHFPLMDVFVQPYIFRDFEHTLAVLSGPVGNEIFDKMASETKVHCLTFGIVMYRELFTTKKQVKNIADMKGLKFRVPKNEVMIRTFKAFGAEPTPLAWSETPSALQTGTVDGGDNGVDTIRAMKFYEIAKYLTVLEHFVAFVPLLASDRFMSKLDSSQKEAVFRAAKEANDFANTKAMAETKENREWLATKGMTVNYPDKTEFIKAAMTVQEYYMETKDKEFADTIKKIHAVKTK